MARNIRRKLSIQNAILQFLNQTLSHDNAIEHLFEMILVKVALEGLVEKHLYNTG